MTKDLIHPILHKPIMTLNVSDEFLAMAEANGYKSLDEILNEPLHKIPFKPLSGYRVLKELVDILEENGLDELMDD